MMKKAGRWTGVALLAGVVSLVLPTAATTPAAARENRVLKCSIGKARRAPSPDGPAFTANAPGAMKPIDLNAVQMTDKKVTKAVLVEGLFASRTPMDTLEVTMRLVNCTTKPIVVQARTSFVDGAQRPTEPMSMWRTIHVPALATGLYQERSVATKTVDAFLVELRSEQ